MRITLIVLVISISVATAQTTEETRSIQGYGSVMAMALAAECGMPLTPHGRQKADIFSYVYYASKGLSPDAAAIQVTATIAELRQTWPSLRAEKKTETCRLIRSIAEALNRAGN